MIVTAVCKKGFVEPVMVQNFVLVNAIEEFVKDNPGTERLLTSGFRTLQPAAWDVGQREYTVLPWTTDRDVDFTLVLWLSPNVHHFDRPIKKQSAKTRKEGDDARLYMSAMGEALGAKEVRPKFVAIRLPNGDQLGFMMAAFEGHLRHHAPVDSGSAVTPTEVAPESVFQPEPVTQVPVEVLATTEPVPHSRGMEDL